MARTYYTVDDALYREVQQEIAENGNAEEFVPEPAAIEEKSAQKTVADVIAGQKQKEPVPAEKKEQEMPAFMKQETM